MTIVWRGAGILVPVVALATAFIVSRSESDAFKGLGLSSLIAGAILLIIGFFTLPGKKTDPATGEVTLKKKHDFFFLPIIGWGILLLLGGVYLSFFK